MTQISQIRFIYKLIIREIPDPRISYTLLYLLSHNLRKSSYIQHEKNLIFFKKFSSFINEFYLNTYNKPFPLLKKEINPYLVEEGMVLKIPSINCEGLEGEYWDFYKVLRDFYLLNLANKDELVLLRIKNKRKMAIKNEKISDEKNGFSFIGDFPNPKENQKKEILFKKGYYWELQCKKVGLNHKTYSFYHIITKEY